jgi:hypothetical protein
MRVGELPAHWQSGTPKLLAILSIAAALLFFESGAAKLLAFPAAV